ncbi:TPA: hypothetical protein ACPY4Y_002081 [Yersinia enterocolitica]|nr:hypothetical protein [Yersinia enterocolitica]
MMYEDVSYQEFVDLKKQVESLSNDLSVHKALLLGLMGELSIEQLQQFSTFRNVLHAELQKLSPQSDEQFYFQKTLNEMLKRALYEVEVAKTSVI